MCFPANNPRGVNWVANPRNMKAAVKMVSPTILVTVIVNMAPLPNRVAVAVKRVHLPNRVAAIAKSLPDKMVETAVARRIRPPHIRGLALGRSNGVAGATDKPVKGGIAKNDPCPFFSKTQPPSYRYRNNFLLIFRGRTPSSRFLRKFLAPRVFGEISGKEEADAKTNGRGE